MMNKFADWLYTWRLAVLCVMMVLSVFNLFFLFDDLRVFWGVLLGQIWSGQCIYAFVSRREIMFSAGAIIKKDASMGVRWAFASLSFFIYCVLFFIRSY